MNKSALGESRINDREAIRDALYRWCRGIDRKDWPVARSAFHPDAYDNHGSYRGDIEGLITWVNERHQTIVSSLHHIGNILIEFAGPDQAVVESYVIARQRQAAGCAQETRIALLGAEQALAEGEIEVTVAGRYVDIFRRYDGRWVIYDRCTVTDSVCAELVPPGLPVDPARNIAQRDRTDPLYEQRAKVGLD